jgi:hypothetical protein
MKSMDRGSVLVISHLNRDIFGLPLRYYRSKRDFREHTRCCAADIWSHVPGTLLSR